ncbi:rac GTPase-activating protein 1 isoform X1, partial [Tachysurus ichikawai]
DTLESFCPSAPPRIPALIIQCVREIERRGLEEKGLYRVPGGERAVKELRERYLSAKAPLLLHRVDEIHVVCGLLKDFLRKLREPLVTFKLHKTFMGAA